MSSDKAPFKTFLLLVLAAGLTACSKKIDSPSTQQSPPAKQEQSTTNSPITPVILPALEAWQQGDKSVAVTRFVETDWSKGPLFPPGSALSLGEKEFQALSTSDQQTKSREMMSQMDSVKRLAGAVAQAGLDATAKNDVAQARRHFASLKQYGDALDRPDSLAIVKLVGQTIAKRADTEMAKLPK